ncbi:hypothetical protein AIOL_002439 [Candidatus Rhodobacter oscarellae]|uniref:Uncharacterized protein n=1 Tax=Candidatus Rhodobacter oscarellae TaxID=1675527 RepID=A0A0J9E6M3_9RHOB|nr:hypothetical protein AIOL_002439 [Candidatus Rhodobacter lobularis]
MALQGAHGAGDSDVRAVMQWPRQGAKALRAAKGGDCDITPGQCAAQRALMPQGARAGLLSHARAG